MIDNKILGRKSSLFQEDIQNFSNDLNQIVDGSSFLVIGGAGSIGQAVCKEIFKLKPQKMYVVDISENNMVELVRDLRSSLENKVTELKTFAIDCASEYFDILMEKEGPFDFVLNLSALKHVRSEKDPYTLMRMLEVNILNTIKTVKIASTFKSKNYFCVSTDKAANPANMMGASKKIMELFVMRESLKQKISMARFANVAFSDGSLLHGFNQRFFKKQPFSAPFDIKRYFISPKESGELCLLSCIFGENRDIFYPKLEENLHLISFSDIAKRYLNSLGYEAIECSSEEEARRRMPELIVKKKWPCYFFESDTVGEKPYEEFFTDNEKLDIKKFSSIGVIKNNPSFNEKKLDSFIQKITNISSKNLSKNYILETFNEILPEFKNTYVNKEKDLDQKM